MGRMGPGHTSMAICSWMLMVAFSPRRRRVMQAARPRSGAVRPGPARPRPRGVSAGPAGRSEGGGQRRRRPPDGPDAGRLPAPLQQARVSAGGWQAGGGPSPRHPAATKQGACAGGAGGAEPEPSEPSGAALIRTNTGAHAGLGPRARTPGRAGPAGRLPLAHACRTRREWSRHWQDAHSVLSRPCQLLLSSVVDSHRTHADVQGHKCPSTHRRV